MRKTQHAFFTVGFMADICLVGPVGFINQLPTDVQVFFSFQRSVLKMAEKLFRTWMRTIECELFPDVLLQITEIFVGFEYVSVLFLSGERYYPRHG